MSSNPKTLFLILVLCMISCAEKGKEKLKQNAPANAAQPAPATTPVPAPIQYQTTSDDIFYFKRGIQCTTANCPYPSVCTDANTCQCGRGLANFPAEGNYGVYCQYTQYNQLAGFLPECLLNLGIGHFLTGRTLCGVFKLLLAFAPCLALCLMMCGIVSKPGDGAGICACIGLVLMFACLIGSGIWWLVDMILFGINAYRDGNGVPLAHW